jgi:hypothetical protein
MRLEPERKWIVFLQVSSMGMIWVFVLGVSAWIFHLIRLSISLHDAPTASVGISIVAIPVFMTCAGVLTYVFVGLQRGRHSLHEDADEERPS